MVALNSLITTAKCRHLALVFVMLAARVAHPAERYYVTDLGAGSGSHSYARGINSFGQVVGYIVNYDQTETPFLWQPNQANSTVGTSIGLGILSEGTSHMALGLSTRGQVVGFSGADAFVWQPETPNSLSGAFARLDSIDRRPGLPTIAYSINDAGQIVGASATFTPELAVLWQPTPDGSRWTLIQLDVAPSVDFASTALAINNIGQIVGSSGNPFLWQPVTPNAALGSMISLGDLPGGSDAGGATGINDRGQIVGSSSVSSYTHAFLWNPLTPNGTVGTMLDLGDLPGGISSSGASAIDSFGNVVGTGTVGGALDSDRNRAFLWSAAQGMVNLNELLDPDSGDGWTLYSAHDINDAGQIVGHGRHHGEVRAYLLTPIPEPTTANFAVITLLIGSHFRRMRLQLVLVSAAAMDFPMAKR
jgi:probable HAF family extracellular repeat protein